MAYGEIDTVVPQRRGIVIEFGANTYRINVGAKNALDRSELNEAFEFIEAKVSESTAADAGEERPDAEGTDRSLSERLQQLNELRDEGLLTDEEYQEKKSQILEEL